MALDGKLLARARAALAERRAENEKETKRREREVYSRIPRIAELDRKLSSLVSRAVGEALKKGQDTEKAVAEIAQESLDIQSQRTELLSRAGYPRDYLEEIYSCKKCADTGYVKGRMCDCLRKLYDHEQAKQLSRLIRLGSESFESFDLTLYDDKEPDPEVKRTPRRWMQTVLENVRDYAAGFGDDSPNLLFYGGTGLGKTFTSACIARVVAAKGFSVFYESVSGALEPFEAVKFGRAEPDSEAYSERDRILDCDLLILDDLGTEMQTVFSTSALYTIINTRLISGKKTIISTNLNASREKSELRGRYGAQIASRLEGEYVAVPFIGSDIRQRKKAARGL